MKAAACADRFIDGTFDRHRVHRRSQIHGETGPFEGEGPIPRGCAQPVEWHLTLSRGAGHGIESRSRKMLDRAALLIGGDEQSWQSGGGVQPLQCLCGTRHVLDAAHPVAHQDHVPHMLLLNHRLQGGRVIAVLQCGHHQLPGAFVEAHRLYNAFGPIRGAIRLGGGRRRRCLRHGNGRAGGWR